MSAVPGTRQCADDLMLTEPASELVNGEEQRSLHGAVDEHDMFLRVDVRNCAMISIVAIAFSDEAVK